VTRQLGTLLAAGLGVHAREQGELAVIGVDDVHFELFDDTGASTTATPFARLPRRSLSPDRGRVGGG
jgi:hypothetical protein